MIAAGTLLGHYEIRAKLGAGGMGDVYLAEDIALARKVALKVLPADTGGDDHARRRFVREARAAAALDHPHICAVYEVGEADGRLYIAMQYVEGETLDARMRRAALDLDDVLRLGGEVADALADAHAHGVLHRDVKPGNVMITARGQAKVMDFGLAKHLSAAGEASAVVDTRSSLSLPGSVVGTVPYMSPEQVRGDELDARSDIFSLGVMLYEMVSGRRPFDDSSPAATASAILTRHPPPLARFAPEMPPELERIVAKALRKDREERYQTAQDLLIDLRALKDEREFRTRLERSAAAQPAGPAAMPLPGSAPESGSVVVGAPATSSGAARVTERARSSGRRLAVAAALVVAAVTGGWFAWRTANVRWATEQLPRIQSLADARQTFEAYNLAQMVARYLPNDPGLRELYPSIADAISVVTDPPGAQVYLKRFALDASGGVPPRVLVGVTPVTNLRVARGDYVISVEKEGFAFIERTISGVIIQSESLKITPPPTHLDLTLVPSSRMPPGMVFVPGGDYRLVAWSRPIDRRAPLSDYFIDKYEVTNQDFKAFINAGGYLMRAFWTEPIVRDGKALSWDEAMKVFVDRSGLPGPREWSNQSIPEGKADHPVTGVTWYEAAAYASFRGKQLPSVFQWEKAARNGRTMGIVNLMPWGPFYAGDTLAHRANFGSTGTQPVNTAEFGMSPFGAHHMAGNVTEWTVNGGPDGYFATGGSWNDPTYVFGHFGPRPGLFSANTLGFRCVLLAPGATGDQGSAPIEVTREIPTYSPPTDAVFESLAAAYRYEATALDSRIEATVETPEWTRQKITFNGANGARAIAYLYLPRHAVPPLQVIHYVPGADVDNGMRSIVASMDERLSPFVRSGRAAFGVVLEGYFERLTPDGRAPASVTTVEYLERVVNRVTELRRGLDYLQTRDDIDASRVVFFGLSAGAHIGVVLAAVEPRYRAILLVGSGLPAYTRPYYPAANPGNFASRIRGPKLMIQGRYDEDTPLSTAAEPLFAFLSEPKRMTLFDGGHVPPVDTMLRAAAPWLDEVVGPVRRN